MLCGGGLEAWWSHDNFWYMVCLDSNATCVRRDVMGPGVPMIILGPHGVQWTLSIAMQGGLDIE